jgi:hypothetical protein
MVVVAIRPLTTRAKAHKRSECLFGPGKAQESSDFNTESVPWHFSTNGIRIRARN